jgi:hypothetical protein
LKFCPLLSDGQRWVGFSSLATEAPLSRGFLLRAHTLKSAPTRRPLHDGPGTSHDTPCWRGRDWLTNAAASRPVRAPEERSRGSKPKGTRNKTTLAVEALLDGEAETLTRKAIELAKAGDLAALRVCLDRIAPEAIAGRPVAPTAPASLVAAPRTVIMHSP